MITFPTWYEGGFPDMEATVKTILEKHLAGSDPAVPVVAWLRDDWRQNLPQIVVARVPGGLPDDSQLDTSDVQVWALAESRADAWAIAECVRQIMKAYCHAGMVDTAEGPVRVHSIEATAGPELSMEDSALNERTIPMTFRVTLRARASLPDYAERLLG